MTELLLCPPTYYTVDYEINPWMHIHNKPDRELAESQWTAFYRLLTELKVTVHRIDPKPGLPDMVFTANGGLVFGNKFIVSNFRHAERAKEAPVFASWFKNRGYEVVHLPRDRYFEGEGDALMFGDTLVAGFKFRSDIHSHRYIGEVIGRRVISLELASPNFYHLDTCFCPLNDETAIYYPEAFDSYGREVLKHIIPNLIEVGRKDAMNFCCNAVVSGKNVIMNNCSAELRRRMETLGLNVFQLSFSEFIKAGGSSKCLSLYLKSPHNEP